MTGKNRKSIIFKSELCIGCYSCVVSCMDQNDLDTVRDALSWRRIEHIPERGERAGEVNVSIACMQCEDAACIRACPAGAIARDAATRQRHRAQEPVHRLPRLRDGLPLRRASLRKRRKDAEMRRLLRPHAIRTRARLRSPTAPPALSFEGANEAMEAKAAAAARTLT